MRRLTKPEGRKRTDHTGKKYGRLLILQDAPDRVTGNFVARQVFALCDCGTEKVVPLYDLTKGNTRSCGCLAKETHSAGLAKRRAEGHEPRLRHGHARKSAQTRTYASWLNMHRRCSDPKATQWKWYGGRGVSVCSRWGAFENFIADMGLRPEGMSIDRIDPNGNYEPGNCRWATALEQRHNRRDK